MNKLLRCVASERGTLVKEGELYWTTPVDFKFSSPELACVFVEGFGTIPFLAARFEPPRTSIQVFERMLQGDFPVSSKRSELRGH